MNEQDLKKRTKEFAKRIVLFCRGLPTNREGKLIGNQLFRSGTSVGANYRASCRGRSKKDFITKLGIVEEESDESIFWLELINELKIADGNELKWLLKEANEILAIIVVSIKTVRRNS